MKIFHLFTTFVLTLFVYGCTTYVPVEANKSHHREVLSTRTDSIYVLDSVLVYINGDTVRETRWRDRWREVIKKDTVFIADTIPKVVTIEVEKKLSFFNRIRLGTWNVIAFSLLIIIFIFLIRSRV